MCPYLYCVPYETHFKEHSLQPFNGKTNFSIWQSIVKDILAQQGLTKVLEGKVKKPVTMKDEEWADLEAKAVAIGGNHQTKFGAADQISNVPISF